MTIKSATTQPTDELLRKLEPSRRKRYLRLKMALIVCRRNLATNELAIIGAKQVLLDDKLTFQGAHLVGKYQSHWQKRKEKLAAKEQSILTQMDALISKGVLL